MKITQQMIKARCGEVSFKKGDSFYRSNKVLIESYSEEECKAKVVVGSEEFNVFLVVPTNGKIHTECSCPKLASYNKDCQHVAAVLTAIQHKQSNDLFSLFQKESKKESGHQRHFETREVLDTRFTFHLIDKAPNHHVIGVTLFINQLKVEKSRELLKRIKGSEPFRISSTFTYNPDNHCFEQSANQILWLLIDMIDNELSSTNEENALIVTPAAWRQIEEKLPLENTNVQDGEIFFKAYVRQEQLPLSFLLKKGDPEGYTLHTPSIHKAKVLVQYECVVIEGKLFRLNYHDCKRLSELKNMTKQAREFIPIMDNQLGFFLEKVVPGLKQLGNVLIDDNITNSLIKAPLVAKLYLDRVKNRLLAGLDFHYENIILSPFQKKEPSKLIVRDTKKEEIILSIMEEANFVKTEEGYYLQNEEQEYHFLTTLLPKLEKLTRIYATTAVRNRIFKGTFKPQIRVKMNKERTNWLEFTFDLKGIANEEIKEVLIALEQKRKYYRLRNGSLLSLETREVEEIQAFLRSAQVDGQDLLLGVSVPINQALELLDHVEGSSAFMLEASFQEFLDTLKNPGKLTFSIPDPLNTILKEYQKQGFNWMKTLSYYGFGGILADDMGLGKTIQSISFIQSELNTIRYEKKPVLIVSPSSVTYNWLHECKKFAPEIKAVVFDGPKQKRTELQSKWIDADVVITSYPLIRKDQKWYEKQRFSTVIFDEAQAFKNPLTQTAKAVKKIQAENRFALTGTPIENSREELWSIFHVVFPNLFLGLKEFSQLSKKAVTTRVRPFILRRMKEDVLDAFPKKKEITESVELLPEQKKLYTAYLAKLRHDTLKHLDKETFYKNRIKILAGLTRLRQICCHPQLFVDGYKGGSAKFNHLFTIVKEAKMAGRRVLIFSQFTKMLDLIGKELTENDTTFFYLDGQTEADERVKLCDRFNQGERDFFLISLKAGGTGLNLTGADTVILYDTWWNPAVEEQAADRAHRIGQKNTVHVIKLLTSGTIETKINDLQEKKRNLVEELLDFEKGELTSFNVDEVKELLK
ncbi:DEAD/DEAH box helicase [Bacillus weihaiensis]|uniref:Helicase SNF n=1 Tax=Bacillus weihaiensis TaxID=1547283 RepID=A0A1L3MRX9_9BACI|nr:DEAD/DEAH box helicase [Bacillus weihaiensis]APH05086.1 helicase SNF [Bacillus weihaiensis]